MGTQRASNKDILDAINSLTQAITSMVVAPKQVEADVPVLTERAAPRESNGAIDIDKPYLAHMQAKVAQVAKDKGENYVLYARKNGLGETKLAYTPASKWSALKDRGLIGPVAMIEA